MLKGHATIELTDVNTGEKRVIEQDNMVTNAFQDLCSASFGTSASAIANIINKNESAAETLFGGILLFDGVLSSDPDDYLLPSDVNCVGYAKRSAYGGIDTAMGSYNVNESSVNDDGTIKHVWDFGTSYANGTIASIALAPIEAVNSGIGNVIHDKNLETDSNNSLSTIIIRNNNPDSGVKKVCNIYGDFLYSLDEYNINSNSIGGYHFLKNGGILRIGKYKCAVETIGAFDKLNVVTYDSTIEVKLPDDFISSGQGTYPQTSVSVCGDKIYIAVYGNQLIPINGQFNVVEIDMKNDFSVSSFTMTNTTGERLHIGFNYMLISDIYSVFQSESKKLYIVKTKDNTDIKLVKNSDGSNLNTSTKKIGTEMNGNVFLSIGRGSYFESLFILNLKNCTLHSSYIYSREFDRYTLGQGNFIKKVIQISSNSACTGAEVNEEIFVNKFLLSTKNNLDTPVVKTASQSMKITYTLSEE